eukprot:scaffold964_cov261-Pinguiococcus_pyrenoidosus.AAC.11
MGALGAAAAQCADGMSNAVDANEDESEADRHVEVAGHLAHVQHSSETKAQCADGQRPDGVAQPPAETLPSGAAAASNAAGEQRHQMVILHGVEGPQTASRQEILHHHHFTPFCGLSKQPNLLSCPVWEGGNWRHPRSELDFSFLFLADFLVPNMNNNSRQNPEVKASNLKSAALPTCEAVSAV